jgi:polysaccharide biosynthesis transport protein
MNDSIEEKRETSMRDFLAVVFRRKGIVFGGLLATIGLVVALRLITPPQYESTADVLLSRGQPESAFNNRVRTMLTWEEELTSELETITSSHIVALAQKALDDGGAKDSHGRPIKIEPFLLSATTPGKSSVIELKSRHADPVAAREIARAVIQSYSSFRLNIRSVPELEAYFREEIDAVREQLEDWEQRRADFMSEESVARLPDERASMISIRQNTEIELNRVRTDLAAEQARFEVVQSAMGRAAQGTGADSAAVYAFSELGNNDDQVIFRLKAELVVKRSEYLAARAQFQDDHPTVMALKEQVEKTEELLGQEINHYQEHLRGRAEVLRAKEDALLSALAYVDGEIASYPSKEARLSAFDRMISALQTDYQALVDKQIQARLERIGTSDWNVLILQPASEAGVLRTTDSVRLALIPVIGLIVALAVAFLVDGLDHSLKDATEAEQQLGLPVLGSVGRLR